jgi:hypothetical protein
VLRVCDGHTYVLADSLTHLTVALSLRSECEFLASLTVLGCRLCRYLVRDYLGSAAFSSALSCEDMIAGRDVCLKVRSHIHRIVV